MSTLSDTGHHNCRDYHLPPARNQLISPAPTASQILHQRTTQKSPLNKPINRPTFPFLRLPYELRRQIYHLLLPHTETKSQPGNLFNIPSNTSTNAAVSAHKIHLASLPSANYTKNSILWHRGQTSLLSVSKQLWKECSSILYGENVFVLFVAYDGITFRFRWVLPSRLAPSVTFDFLGLLGGKRYVGLIRKVVVDIDCVDEYTGMIKYNVGGSGLTYGLRMQVKKLVKALRTGGRHSHEGGLKRLTVRLMNGNEAALDSEKRSTFRSRESSRTIEDVQTVLEPLKDLKGLVDVNLHGAIKDEYKQELRNKMMQR